MAAPAEGRPVGPFSLLLPRLRRFAYSLTRDADRGNDLVQETCARAIDEAMLSIATLDGTLEAELFPPLPASHCRICNFQELCPAGREWLNQNR